MAGDGPHPRRARTGLRQALLALAVSALVVGGIAVASEGSGSHEATLTSGTSSTAIAVESNTATTATSTPGVAAVPSSDATTLVTAIEVPGSVPVDVTAPPTAVETLVLPTTTAPSRDASASAAAVPAIDARAYAVYDVSTHTWLANSNPDTPMPVGSVMKLLTSYVVLQAGELGKVVTVPALEVDASESAIGLYQGETLARDVLLRAMLIVSANDAARTLAIDVGGTTDGFVAAMNAAAAQLGLTNTVAANPIGLDAAGAHSSARDVVSLAELLMRNDVFRQAVGKSTARLHGQVFTSTNRLLTSYPGADGVKTGHTTDAGYCVVGSATREGRTVIVAVLGAGSDDSRLAGASALLDWAFAHPA